MALRPIATILTEHYATPVTEEIVLGAMGVSGGEYASFADMQRSVANLGFRAVGLHMSLEALTQIQLPVITHIRVYRGEDHFAVLRGIDKDTVRLADSSAGNRTMSLQQFASIWSAIADENESEPHGRVMVILPLEGTDMSIQEDYFTPSPIRHTSNALKILVADLLWPQK